MIYQDESNDLNLLRDKYGVTWWDEWDIGNRTIGSCYGETVRRHNLVNKLLDGIIKDPYGRRHIINLGKKKILKKTWSKTLLLSDSIFRPWRIY